MTFKPSRSSTRLSTRLQSPGSTGNPNSPTYSGFGSGGPGNNLYSPNRAQPPATKPGWQQRYLQLNTWRGQALLLAGILIAVTLVALLIIITNTNNRVSKFHELATVEVPAIDATNNATQFLSGEVADTADYILSDQTNTNNRSALLTDIEHLRANYAQALQANYTALTTYPATITPTQQSTLNYLSIYDARLRDSLAQARGLIDSNNKAGAEQTYLNGQNAYYQQIISTLYFLRSVHIFQLEDAANQADSAAALQQYVAAGMAIVFVVALLAINIWLTLKVKRAIIPLVNLALIVAIAYSVFLWITFSNTTANLRDMEDSYNNVASLTDAQLYITDAATDQVQGIIGGQTNADKSFTPDPSYGIDLTKRLEHLLAVNDTSGNNKGLTNPAAITSCPATITTSYTAVGTLADFCRRLDPKDSQQRTTLNLFITNYQKWLTANQQFNSQVNTGDFGGGLNARNSNSTPIFNQMIKNLSDLKTANLNNYQTSSTQGTNSLDLAILLAWIVYLGGLVLAEVGLLRWRQAF